jgi:hypothetical protein
VVVAKKPDHVAAFKTLERARTFLAKERDERGEFQLVCRATFEAVADKLRWCGIHGLCLEPDTKGIGDEMLFSDLEHSMQPPQPARARPRIKARRFA